MSTFPGSPKLVKGGLVLINPDTSKVERIISFQYNPDSLSRTLQAQTLADANNRSQPMRLTGPPVETIKLDAEIDATDQMQTADTQTAETGIHSQLAALETIIYPASSQLISNNNLSKSGTLEIIPMEAALTLFIWNKNRIIPVRITDFSITEEAFDANLNPIRAKVSLGMRVLNMDDLGFDHKGASLYMSYHQNKEKLAGMFRAGTLNELGINSIP
jgi:Contractile injection system tube protein